MLFLKIENQSQNLPSASALQGCQAESVSQHGYVGILIDGCLACKPHIRQRLPFAATFVSYRGI